MSQLIDYAVRVRSHPRFKWLLATAVLACLFIGYGLYWYASSGRKLVLAAMVAFGVLPVGALLMAARGILSSTRGRLIGFATLLSCSCLLFAVLFPPFSVADEFHHYLSSYWLSECATGSAELDRPATVEMRRDDWEVYSDHGARDERNDYQTFTIDAESYQQVFEEFSWGQRYEGSYEIPEDLMFNFTLGNENVVAKVGSVVGLLFGRLLGLGAYPVFYLGRIFSAAFFVVCVIAAIHITPVGKNVIMAISFLPMVLQEAASYSYDGGTIGLSFVFIALVLRAVLGEGALSRRMMVALALFATLLAPCKAVYVLEVGLVLLIPGRRFTSRRAAVAYKAGVLALAALAVSADKLAMVSSVSSGTTTFAFPGERTFSLYDLISDPLGTIFLFARTFDVSADNYWMSAVGFSLGWLQQNLVMPSSLMGLYVVGMLYSSQRSEDDAAALSGGLRAALFAVAALVWIAVMVSMAVSWTPSTSETIQGVQGRYILPALPLLMLSFRSGRAFLSGGSGQITLALFSGLNALYMIRFIAVALLV